MDSIQLRRPDDFHLHLRRGDMLRAVLPHSAREFGRGLLMPNTTPPILDGTDVDHYRQEVAAANRWSFQPLFTIKLTAATTPDTVRHAHQAGAVAAKLYPIGVTTNSADGVDDIERIFPALAAMSALGMVLCLHGEQPGVFCLDREEAFVRDVLPVLVSTFPRLRIVIEHISTAFAIDWLLTERIAGRAPNVAASITVHHLLLTLDDVVGDLLAPHSFCKPLAKRPEDRSALLSAAINGDPSFFLGTDSAPHLRLAKESAAGCAGVFSAPVALAVLAEIFEGAGQLSQLEAFTSVNGATFYQFPLNQGVIHLVRKPWIVPAEYAGVVPFFAGRELSWQVLSDGAVPG